MKYFIQSILFLVFFCNTTYSQDTATTKDGVNVLLNSDGTWEYVDTGNPKPSSDEFDFRSTTWGMSKHEVKLTETGSIKKDSDNILAYSDKVLGLDAFVVYLFTNNKLVRCKYIFTEKHSNKNDYIFDYDEIKSSLTQKYKEPQKDNKYWRNDLYENDYDQRGFAISLGHLSYFTSWETGATKITLALKGENYKVNLAIEYTSKAYENLEKDAKQEKNNSKL